MTSLITAGFDLTVEVGETSQILGVNMEITEKGLQGWTGGGVPVRSRSTARLNRHGEFTEPGKRGARLVTLTGSYWADTVREAAGLVDTLNALLADGGEGRLTVIDTAFGTRWANCLLIGTPDVEYDGTESGTFSFDLKCPDPLKYGVQITELTTGAARAGGGAYATPFFGSTNAPGVMDFGSGGSAGTVTWTNEGTAEVFPTFAVHGETEGFTITEIETERRTVFDQYIPPGQYIELDPATATVMLNGDVDRSDGIVIAQWPAVPPKATRTYMLESSTPETVTMTMTAVPAWW